MKNILKVYSFHYLAQVSCFKVAYLLGISDYLDEEATKSPGPQAKFKKVLKLSYDLQIFSERTKVRNPKINVT
jgi:hypothetical protein